MAFPSEKTSFSAFPPDWKEQRKFLGLPEKDYAAV